MTKVDMIKSMKIAKDCLDKTLDAIIYDKLSDVEKVEFFEIYRADIISMVEDKIKQAKKMIKEYEKKINDNL